MNRSIVFAVVLSLVAVVLSAGALVRSVEPASVTGYASTTDAGHVLRASAIPIPAPGDAGLPLVSNGVGVTPSWQALPGASFPDSGVFPVVQTATMGAPDATSAIVIPIAPIGGDASTYVGLVNLDLIAQGRLIDASDCWWSERFNIIADNAGGALSLGAFNVGPSSNPETLGLAWAVDSGLDGSNIPLGSGSTGTDGGNVVLNLIGWQCPGHVTDASTFVTTVTYTATYSN